MAFYNRLSLVKNLRISNSSFSTSCTLSSKWRKQQGLEENPMQFGPLTQLPDYSFADGRPVPVSCTKLKKIRHQQSLCKKIVELSHELDVGLEMYYERKKQEQKKKETIIKNKLIAKGAALLKNKKESTSN